MEHRRLGKSGVTVTDICMGTMVWPGQCDAETGIAIMDRAYDAGIDFFDTAELYPVPPNVELAGQTEEIVGRWLKTKPRDSVILATKITGFAGGWFRGPNRSGKCSLDRNHIFKAVEGSLQRLQTDYIDLYQTHWPDHDMRQEDTLEALTELVQAGKIRVIGNSNETCWGLMKGLWAADKHGTSRYDTIQNNFSIMNRRCESELAQVCRQEKISLLPYSPLGAGVLTGKYNDGPPAGARFTDYLESGEARQKAMATRFVNEGTIETARRVAEVAQDINVSPAALSIAWSRQHDFVASTIIGARTLGQLEENLQAVDLVLDDETMQRIDQISTDIPQPYGEDGLRYL